MSDRGVKRPHPDQSTSLDVIPLRVGQWTIAEMNFANRVIEYFDKGSLPNCTNGTTLRALLADILHCSPMRISKKYAGDGAIGKRTFTKLSAIDKTQLEELRALELEFHESLQGRARWPLVEWKTLLLGRTGAERPTSLASSSRLPHQRPQPQQQQEQQQQLPQRRPSQHQHQQQQYEDPHAHPRRSSYMMPPPRPPPPTSSSSGTGSGAREVRYSLHELKEHCQPISLGRLAAEPAPAPPAAPDFAEPSSWQQFATAPVQPQQRPRSSSLHHQDVYGWIPGDLVVPDTSGDSIVGITLEGEQGQPPQMPASSRRRIVPPTEAQRQLQGQLETSSASSPFPPDQPLTAEAVQQELRRRLEEQQQEERRSRQHSLSLDPAPVVQVVSSHGPSSREFIDEVADESAQQSSTAGLPRTPPPHEDSEEKAPPTD